MATYYKRDTNTNWNQNTSWSTVSSASATNAGTFPKAADTAIFDAGSVSCTVNVASACTTLTMTGYAGVLLLTSNLTVTGNITLGGSFDGGGDLILSGTQTITPNNVALGYINLTGTPVITLASNLTCFYIKVGISIQATITGADVNSNTLTIQNRGKLTVQAGRTLTLTKIYINGVEGLATSFVSGTASSDIYVNYIGVENDSVIALATLTDVEFTSAIKMKNWWGTNTRVTNCDVVTLADVSVSNLTIQ